MGAEGSRRPGKPPQSEAGGKQRGQDCHLRPYLAFTVDLGPSIDQDLHNLQVAEPGRQEERIHPKLGERTQGGEEKGRRQRCGCGHMAKPFIWVHISSESPGL